GLSEYWGGWGERGDVGCLGGGGSAMLPCYQTAETRTAACHEHNSGGQRLKGGALRRLLFLHFPDADGGVARGDQNPVSRESQGGDPVRAVALHVEVGNRLARGGGPEPHDARRGPPHSVVLPRPGQDFSIRRKGQALVHAGRALEGEPLLARGNVPQFHVRVLAGVGGRQGLAVRRERDRENLVRRLTEGRQLLSGLHVPHLGSAV